MSATLRVERSARIGFELRRRPFEVMVDGNEVASLEVSGTDELPVEPGQHTLQMRSGRYSSRSLSFDVDNEEVANFRCHGPLVWPIYVASLIVPSLGISLRRE
jgi:hypothetical protein